jgi:hypothetical protein
VELWDEIDSALGKGKVEAAAAALRRHLKYISRLLADQLGAAPQFRADGNYELGDLLPAVLARMKDLYSKVATAAQSWGKNDEKETISERKAALSATAGASNVEQRPSTKPSIITSGPISGKRIFRRSQWQMGPETGSQPNGAIAHGTRAHSRPERCINSRLIRQTAEPCPRHFAPPTGRRLSSGKNAALKPAYASLL